MQCLPILAAVQALTNAFSSGHMSESYPPHPRHTQAVILLKADYLVFSSDLHLWPDPHTLPNRPGVVVLAGQAWVVLTVVSVLCSLLEVAEGFAARAEVSEQIAVFLIGDGGGLCTYVNWSRGAVVIPWGTEGKHEDAGPSVTGSCGNTGL